MNTKHHEDPHTTAGTPGAVHDPVCNHWINPAKAAGTTTFLGTEIHFCSTACKRAFDKQPDKFFPRLRLISR